MSKPVSKPVSKTESKPGSDILILGAGMIGIASALELQTRGHDVTVVDRRGPGLETSYGNAGIIQSEAAEPYALPHDLPTLLAYALGRSNDVRYSPAEVARLAPSLWQYFRNSGRSRHRAISRIYAPLTHRATEDHAPLIEAAGAGNLVSPTGLVNVYRDARAFEAQVADLARLDREYGVSATVMDGAAYAASEPAIRKVPAGAVHWTQSWSCADPGGLVAAYAALFEKRGGRIVTGDAGTLRATGSKDQGTTGWQVDTPDGPVCAADVVVALGPWSPALLRGFGYDIPMVYKRGYHAHYKAPVTLNRPYLDTGYGVVLAPMRKGLRLTTGAALVAQDAPSAPHQVTVAARGVTDLIDLGPRVEEPQWFGTRPCMPDMLPMVGAAPRHAGLWFHFGHGHQGFTLGPTTARILAMAMAGEADPLAAPLAPAGRLRIA